MSAPGCTCGAGCQRCAERDPRDRRDHGHLARAMCPIHADVTTTERAELDEAERDGRLLEAWIHGYVAGATSTVARLAGREHVPTAYAEARHAVHHLRQDPIARAQVLADIHHILDTGEQPPAHVVDVHGHPHGPQDPT